MKRKHLLIGATALALAGGGAGAVGAFAGGDESERQATGPDAQKAKAAALRLVPGGTAEGVERDDEKGAFWEVEVEKSDGSSVDVRLDEAFNKVADDADTEKADASR